VPQLSSPDLLPSDKQNRPLIKIPERFFAYQKQRITHDVLDFLNANPMTAESFITHWDGVLYRVTKDPDEALLVPIVDEYGAPIQQKKLSISNVTMRSFIKKAASAGVPRMRKRTWQYLFACFQAATFLTSRER
jgi:hypothetical protein